MNKLQRLFRKEVKPQAIGGRKGRYLNRYIKTKGKEIVYSHGKP